MDESIKQYEVLIQSIEIQLEDNIESCVSALKIIKRHSSKGAHRNRLVCIKSKELLKQIDKFNYGDCFPLYCSILVLLEIYKKSPRIVGL